MVGNLADAGFDRFIGADAINGLNVGNGQSSVVGGPWK